VGTIRVNISTASSVPDEIRRAIKELQPETTEDWVVSVIPAQDSSTWELRLSSSEGHSDSVFLEPEKQSSAEVKSALRALLVKNMKIDRTIWIDHHVSLLKAIDSTQRSQGILNEIRIYEASLKEFGSVIPHDAPAEAHIRAYLAALKNEFGLMSQ
jgi:hypothetical protein